MTYQCISVEQANHLIEEGDVTILDIRDPQSFAQGHIPNAVHVTNSNVEEVVQNANKKIPLIIYCYHGNSSQGAADYFANMGFENSLSVDGGFEAWRLKAPQ